MKKSRNRRHFLKAGALSAAGSYLAGHLSGSPLLQSQDTRRLALLGGKPVRRESRLQWPIWDREAEDRILAILRSGNWWRGAGTTIDTFEEEYAKMIGARRCLATASGTTALLTSLHALGIDAGDEVLVAPYTFIATYNVVFCAKALPVFVDTDPQTYTMDPEKIEERITERTRAILPVHIYGLPADMNRINELARRYDLAVIEDACQAWLAEYDGRRCGTLGDLGCFSFQNSKNLPAGEGGAITGDDEALMDRCYSYHNHGRAHGVIQKTYSINGSNYRMQQFQAAILLNQMKRVERDARLREENARHLHQRLDEIEGIQTFRLSDGAERSAHHVYPFRYEQERFAGVPKDRFMAALRAEGIPCGGGYPPQNQAGLIEEQLTSRGFGRLFSKERLARYREENHLPNNDRVCAETVTLSQRLLLGSRKDMDQIADAILKIRENLDQLRA